MVCLVHLLFLDWVWKHLFFCRHSLSQIAFRRYPILSSCGMSLAAVCSVTRPSRSSRWLFHLLASIGPFTHWLQLLLFSTTATSGYRKMSRNSGQRCHMSTRVPPKNRLPTSLPGTAEGWSQMPPYHAKTFRSGSRQYRVFTPPSRVKILILAPCYRVYRPIYDHWRRVNRYRTGFVQFGNLLFPLIIPLLTAKSLKSIPTVQVSIRYSFTVHITDSRVPKDSIDDVN